MVATIAPRCPDGIEASGYLAEAGGAPAPIIAGVISISETLVFAMLSTINWPIMVGRLDSSRHRTGKGTNVAKELRLSRSKHAMVVRP